MHNREIIHIVKTDIKTQLIVRNKCPLRTNFSMPDVVSVGLGGGSYVRETNVNGKLQVKVGPLSAGYRIISEAFIFAETMNIEGRQVTALLWQPTVYPLVVKRTYSTLEKIS